MHPYRTPPEPSNEATPHAGHEELVLEGLLIGIGGLRVVLAIAAGQRFDTEVTIALGMLIAGCVWSFRRLAIVGAIARHRRHARRKRIDVSNDPRPVCVDRAPRSLQEEDG